VARAVVSSGHIFLSVGTEQGARGGRLRWSLILGRGRWSGRHERRRPRPAAMAVLPALVLAGLENLVHPEDQAQHIGVASAERNLQLTKRREGCQGDSGVPLLDKGTYSLARDARRPEPRFSHLGRGTAESPTARAGADIRVRRT
jgi:hypothetical protein